MVLASAAMETVGLLAQIDVNPTTPPGMENMTKLIGWFGWFAFIVAIIGIVIGAGTLGVSAMTGGELRNTKAIGLGIVGCVIIGAAGAIVGALM